MFYQVYYKDSYNISGGFNAGIIIKSADTDNKRIIAIQFFCSLYRTLNKDVTNKKQNMDIIVSVLY